MLTPLVPMVAVAVGRVPPAGGGLNVTVGAVVYPLPTLLRATLTPLALGAYVNVPFGFSAT